MNRDQPGVDEILQTVREFIDEVVPELQRRGIFRREYSGFTLREHLGLPMPVNRYSKRKP